MSNLFVLRGLNIDQDTKNTLDTRISQLVEQTKNRVLNPINYDKTYEAWVIDERQYPNLPQGGYDTEDQARIALSLHQVKPEMNYQELYKMSKFIIQGIQ